MKKKTITASEKLEILRFLSKVPKMNQEKIAAETHHRKVKIGGVLKEFKFLDWEAAKVFCGNDQRILGLRDDYFEKKMGEERDQEETLKALGANLRHELGLPSFNTYMKDGVWINEF